MEAIQKTTTLQYQLKRYLPPRILERNIAPNHLSARQIEYLQKKDHNFKDNIVAEYEESLCNPFPKGPWPFFMKSSCGWVTFTLDDESAARIKLILPEEEDASCPYRLDLFISKPELDFTGQVEQVYVENCKGKKQIVYSQWDHKISTSNWHKKMYVNYHNSWKVLSYQRGNLIKEAQRARLDASLVSLDNPNATCGPLGQKPRSRLVVLFFFCCFVFYFFMCAQCPMQKDYAFVAAKVDKELVIWSDSDVGEWPPSPDESTVSGGGKKTRGKGAGYGKKSRRRVPKRKAGKAGSAGKGAGAPKKKSRGRVPKPKRKAGGKAGGKGARGRKRKAKEKKKTTHSFRRSTSPDEKPARKPSAEVREKLDDETTQIKLAWTRLDRQLKILESQMDKLDASNDRASWNEEPDVKARRVYRNLGPGNAEDFVKGLITWIHQQDNRALQSIAGGQWRELALEDAKNSRDKIVVQREALVKRQYAHSRLVQMLKDVDLNIERNPTYTWHDLYSLTGYDELYRKIMPKPSVPMDNLLADAAGTECETGESDDAWYNLDLPEPGDEPAVESVEPEPTTAAAAAAAATAAAAAAAALGALPVSTSATKGHYVDTVCLLLSVVLIWAHLTVVLAHSEWVHVWTPLRHEWT